jgi:hypothetical protein
MSFEVVLASLSYFEWCACGASANSVRQRVHGRIRSETGVFIKVQGNKILNMSELKDPISSARLSKTQQFAALG